MPNNNYSLIVNSDNGKTKLVYFLMIDTVLLCGNPGSDLFADAPFKFNTKDDELKAREYFKEIEKILKNVSKENYPYVIVSGHYPIWSIAEHGPIKCLVESLRPLLHNYKINAYFAGSYLNTFDLLS